LVQSWCFLSVFSHERKEEISSCGLISKELILLMIALLSRNNERSFKMMTRGK
jgi:hypothetical protein